MASASALLKSIEIATRLYFGESTCVIWTAAPCGAMETGGFDFLSIIGFIVINTNNPKAAKQTGTTVIQTIHAYGPASVIHSVTSLMINLIFSETMMVAIIHAAILTHGRIANGPILSLSLVKCI